MIIFVKPYANSLWYKLDRCILRQTWANRSCLANVIQFNAGICYGAFASCF